MKASELVTVLNEMLAKIGDHEVMVRDADDNYQLNITSVEPGRHWPSVDDDNENDDIGKVVMVLDYDIDDGVLESESD